MTLRKTHRLDPGARRDRGAHDLGKRDGGFDPGRRSQAADGNVRVAGGEQLLGQLPGLPVTDAVDARRPERRHLEVAGVLLLQFGIEHDHRGSAGRCDRLAIALLEVIERVGQRLRPRVPFRVRACDAGDVVGGLRPQEVRVVASDDDHHRRLRVIGLIDRHRCVHEADRAVDHCDHRAAFGFGVAVGHIDGGFFVQRRDELGPVIRSIAVVDDRFLQALEAGRRIGGDVLDIEVAQDLHHEVGTGPRYRSWRKIAGCGDALVSGKLGRTPGPDLKGLCRRRCLPPGRAAAAEQRSRAGRRAQKGATRNAGLVVRLVRSFDHVVPPSGAVAASCIPAQHNKLCGTCQRGARCLYCSPRPQEASAHPAQSGGRSYAARAVRGWVEGDVEVGYGVLVGVP